MADACRIEVLGGFRLVANGREVAPGGWPGRRAAELVQLLALSPGRRLAREQAIEALWPHLSPEAGAANLRKAAHHARQTIGAADAVVLRGGQVALLAGRAVTCDAHEFERAAQDALRSGEAGACAAAAVAYTGDLLPASLYEDWTQAPRLRLRSLQAELLRRAGDWERLAELEPADEQAHRELMLRALRDGNRHVALRWYARLRMTLRRELGAAPGEETEAVYDECVAGMNRDEPAFVGRDVELARALAGLRDPGTSLLAVRGAAGIGKSAFVRELLARAGGTPFAVTAGDGPPFAPVAALASQVLAGDPALAERLPERTRTILAGLSPAFAAPSLEGVLTRHQVIGAIARLLALRAERHGRAVLVLDDAHAADDATADALPHLTGPSLIVVAAYRPEAARSALLAAVDGLRRARQAVEIDLGPLASAEVSELVDAASIGRLPRQTAERIAELAEGNPFFVVELARGGEPAGPALARRFLSLGDEAAARLGHLAVGGGEFDHALALAVTGMDEEELGALLDEALAHGVLVVSGGRYRFRHELVRQALVERLPEHRRLAVHRDTARRLAVARAAPAAIAAHWIAGGRPDEAVDWLLAAARRARDLGAFQDALRHLDPLLDHTPEHIAALSLRAEALDALGDPRAPAAYAAAADATGEPGAQEIRPREALARLKAGDPQGALDTLEGVTPATTAGRLCEALTLSGAAAIGWFADADLAAAKAQEAYELALELGDSWALLDASWAHALAAHAKGELPARLRAYLRSTYDLPDVAVRVFDGQLCVTQRLLYGALPYAEVIAFADSLAAEAGRLGAARGHGFALTLRGEARMLSGELGPADEDLAVAARLHRAIGAATGEALALQRRAEVALHTGRRAEAAVLARNALATARESEVGYHTLDRIYGTLVALADDRATALAALDEGEAGIRGPAETCPTCRITFVVPAAVAAARAGDLQRARRFADAVETLVEVISLPPAWTAARDEVRGHLAQAGGDGAQAAAHFRRAAEGFAACGQPVDATRCSSLAGAP